MSGALVVQGCPPEDLSLLSNEDLAIRAVEAVRRGTEAVDRAKEGISDALAAALDLGHVLSVVKERMAEADEWSEWLGANVDVSRNQALMYIRYWTYREHLFASSEPVTMKNVAHLVRGLPSVAYVNAVPAQRKAEAQRLRKAGMSYAEIGEVLGVTASAVRFYVDPSASRKLKEARRRREATRQAAAKALAEKERHAAVKRRGGKADRMYQALRNLLPDADQAINECSTPEQREAMRLARSYAQKALDEIWRAVQLGGAS